MKFNKLALASLGAASLVFSGAVAAAPLNDFTINPSGFSILPITPFVADKITGNYVEVVTFNANGTFHVSLKWEAGQFVKNDGVDPIAAGVTRLGVDYGLYALFNGQGTYTVGPTNNFYLSSGSITVWGDDNVNTTFIAPLTGASPWTRVNFADDKQLATGAALNGAGNIICTVGNNCGSFGQTTSFSVTSPDGIAFFAAPFPFYNISFQSGQLNGFTTAGTVTINGSLDVVFQTVPEPTSLALVGLALVGAGFARRRKA